MRQISRKVAFLVVLDQVQGGSRIKNGFGQNAGEQEPDLVEGQSRRFVFEFQSQVDQKMMSQGNQQHMVMPAQPTAGFIMIEAEFPFTFFKDDFDRPAQPAETNQLQQGGLNRGIAKVELEFSRIIKIAADDQPQFRTRQACSTFDHAQAGKITDNRTFTALLNRGSAPSSSRNLSHYSLNRASFRAGLTQPQADWPTASSFPGRQIDLGSVQPDLAGGSNFSEVPFMQSCNSISKDKIGRASCRERV